MLYKNAWKELKDYIKNRLPLLAGQGVIRQTLLSKMRLLEERWKITPPNSRTGGVKRRVEV